MSGSLTHGGGENVPGIPGACATHNFTYLVRGPYGNNYIFSVVSVLLFGAMGMGEALAFAPDYTKARVAAARLFRIMDHNPEIDGTALRGQTPVGYSPHPGCVLDNKHLTY